MKYDTDWLQSDGTIIGRAQKSPHAEGILWSVTMPDGQEFGAVLKEQNAGSVSGFCEMVRGEWDERKEEQAAKARIKESSIEGNHGAPALPEPEAAISFEQSLIEQLDRAQSTRTRLEYELDAIDRECAALQAACEVLSLSHDVKTSVELDLPPDAKPDSTVNDSLHQEADVNASTDEGFNSNSDAAEDLSPTKSLKNTS